MTLEMSNKDIEYWVGFSIIQGIGRVKFTQLENYFGNLKNAWKATPAELKHAGLDGGSLHTISLCQPKISLQAVMEKLEL